MKLVILESPTKTKALSKYLGAGYKVLSSQGHITKLSSSGPFGMGVDLETFIPKFSVSRDKSAIVKKLKTAATQAETIYLATDPDREGEAIAYHIQERIGFAEKTHRVTFNEITKSAVLRAFEQPSAISQPKVESQFARRIIDRMIGYRLSNLLQKKISARSAGRVQSMTLRLIVDREKEIIKFVPEKSWHFFAEIEKIKVPLISYQGKKITIKTPEKRDEIAQKLRGNLTLAEIVNRPLQQKPPKPLKTSSLLQLAGNKLGFSAKKTMFVAQKLYEGIEVDGTVIGFISYPRSDSERINAEFSQKISQQIIKQFKQTSPLALIKKTPPVKNVQDAHEAIRITDVEMDLQRAEKYLNFDQLRLYSLIYQFTFASFMQPSQGITRSFRFTTSDHYEFVWEIKYLVELGFTVILKSDLPLGEKTAQMPPWTVDQQFTPQKFPVVEKESKPRPRFSEAQLIKRLEELGIGRPSTYSGLASKLEVWNYIEKKERKLNPTSKGTEVSDQLASHFSEFINEEYTAQMEQDLDAIAEGRKERVPFLKEFWKIFSMKISQADDKMKNKEPIMLDRKCPDCESELQEREGRYGKFVGCSNYPDCRYIEKTPLAPELADKKCPQCSKDLVVKAGKFGKFVACSGYPDCRYIEKKAGQQTALVTLDRHCPQKDCQAALVERAGRFGKFVACSGFPKCRYIEKKKKSPIGSQN